MGMQNVKHAISENIMNDRFKFRCYNKNDNTIYDVYSFDKNFIKANPINTCVNSIRTFKTSDCILMQCTGLKDKNDKPIFEGDWLKTKDGSYCYVVWFNGFWWVKSLPSEAMDLEHAEFYKECEIVGNIHENKELLDE